MLERKIKENNKKNTNTNNKSDFIPHVSADYYNTILCIYMT